MLVLDPITGQIFVGPMAGSGNNSDISALTNLKAASTVSISPGANATSAGFIFANPAPATAGNQQYSPALMWTAQGWKTAAAAGSQTIDFRAYVVPSQGVAAPTAALRFESRVNGGSYLNPIDFLTDGSIKAEMLDTGGQVFNVKAFGAKGDGVTNDTAAIQAAINAAILSSGIVFFPTGDYLVTTINITSTVTLSGVGAPSDGGSQLITQSNAPLLNITARCTVERMAFKGTINPLFTLQDLILVNGVSDVKLNHILLNLGYNNIRFDGTCFYCSLDRVRFLDAVHAELCTTGNSEPGCELELNFCVVTGGAHNCQYGFLFDNVGSLTITGLMFNHAKIVTAGMCINTVAPKYGGTILAASTIELEGPPEEGGASFAPALQLLGTSLHPVKDFKASNCQFGGGNEDENRIVELGYVDYSEFDNCYVYGPLGTHGFLFKNRVRSCVFNGIHYSGSGYPFFANTAATIIEGIVIDNSTTRGNLPLAYFKSTTTPMTLGDITITESQLGDSVAIVNSFDTPTAGRRIKIDCPEYTNVKLNYFALTSSTELRSKITDPSGSGALLFAHNSALTGQTTAANIVTAGATNAIGWTDRTTAVVWNLYSNAGLARVWNSIAGDVVSVSQAGKITATSIAVAGATNAIEFVDRTNSVVWNIYSNAGTSYLWNSVGGDRVAWTQSGGATFTGALAASNLSGSNTGDQDLSGLVPKLTTVNGHALTGNISLVAADIGGLAASATIDTTNATNITSGTLAATRLPALTGDVTALAGTGSTLIAANTVTNAKAAQMPANTIKGNNTGVAANAADLTASQTKTLLAIAQADVAGLTTASSPTFNQVSLTNGLMVPTSAGTARWATDASGGDILTIANNATAFPFSAANNFAGFIIVNDFSVSGSTAVFVVGGTAAVLISQSRAGVVGSFSDTAATANRINVYVDGSSRVVVENKSGTDPITLRMYAIRVRSSL